MSFGTSVGDIITLVQLAHRSYRNCKDAGGEYLEIAREVRSLHSVLRSVQNESKRPDSLLFDPEAVVELVSLSEGCRGVLEEIDKLLLKYNGLADDGVEKGMGKRLWHRMRFGAEIEELGKFRAKLITYTSQLAVFLDAIHLKSADRLEKATGRVETTLESGFNDVLQRFEGFEEMRKAILFIATKARASERFTSVTSVASVLSLSTCAGDDKEVWRQFRSELVAIGFRSQSLERHREALKAYMMQLDKTGVLDEAVANEGKSRQAWCLNSFFRLTTTELPQIIESEELLVEGGQVPKSPTSGQDDLGAGLEELRILRKAEASEPPRASARATPLVSDLPLHPRRRITRENSARTSTPSISLDLEDVLGKYDINRIEPYFVPSRSTSSLSRGSQSSTDKFRGEQVSEFRAETLNLSTGEELPAEMSASDEPVNSNETLGTRVSGGEKKSEMIENKRSKRETRQPLPDRRADKKKKIYEAWENMGAAKPTSSPNFGSIPQDGREERRKMYEAWENMRAAKTTSSPNSGKVPQTGTSSFKDHKLDMNGSKMSFADMRHEEKERADGRYASEAWDDTRENLASRKGASSEAKDLKASPTVSGPGSEDGTRNIKVRVEANHVIVQDITPSSERDAKQRQQNIPEPPQPYYESLHSYSESSPGSAAKSDTTKPTNIVEIRYSSPRKDVQQIPQSQSDSYDQRAGVPYSTRRVADPRRSTAMNRQLDNDDIVVLPKSSKRGGRKDRDAPLNKRLAEGVVAGASAAVVVASIVKKNGSFLRDRERKVVGSTSLSPVPSDSDSYSDTDEGMLSDSSEEPRLLTRRQGKKHTGIGLKPSLATGRTPSRSPRGHYSTRQSDSHPAGDEEDVTRSKFKRAAKAALLAGATEAFRVRNEPGWWMGAKGERIIVAAIGASAVEKAADSD